MKKIILLLLAGAVGTFLLLCFSSCRVDPSPKHIYLLAPQLLGAPKLYIGTYFLGGDGITIRYDAPVSPEMFRYGGGRELEYSGSGILENEILNALGGDVRNIEFHLYYYDVIYTGNPVFYADAVLFGREPGRDLSDLLFNYHPTLRVTKDFHFDGYFKKGEISMKDWMKDGDLIMATSMNIYFYFPTPPLEKLDGVTFTLEIPVRYAAQWPEYRGSVPYPDNPETTIVCSATMPVSE